MLTPLKELRIQEVSDYCIGKYLSNTWCSKFEKCVLVYENQTDTNETNNKKTGKTGKNN